MNKNKIDFLENFLEEYNKVIISLNEINVLEFYIKYNIKILKDKIFFWTNIHKLRLNIYTLSKE